MLCAHTVRRLKPGTFDQLEQLEGSQRDAGFESRRDSIAGFVDTVIANGVYEIVESLVRDEASPA